MHSQAAWKRLAELLKQRRGQIESNASRFAEKTGLHSRIIYDIEHAKRTNFRAPKLAEIEAAYQWQAGSIQRVLEGGDPTPLGDDAAVPAAPRPDDSPPGLQHARWNVLRVGELLRFGPPIEDKDGRPYVDYRLDLEDEHGNRIGSARRLFPADLPEAEVLDRLRRAIDGDLTV